jgi:hypothetical protein
MGEEIVTAPVLLVRLLAGLIGESRAGGAVPEVLTAYCDECCSCELSPPQPGVELISGEPAGKHQEDAAGHGIDRPP